MAGIKQVIQSLIAELGTVSVTNQDGNTVALYAHVWNNHVEMEKVGAIEAYPKPAAFVEIQAPTPYDNIGLNFRSSDITVNLHLVHEYYNQDGTMEQDLTIFDLRDKVLAAITGFQPTACGPMVSNGEVQDYDHDNVYHFILSFTCHFVDSKGSQYDAGRSVYIEKEPPTDLDLRMSVDDTPVFNNIPQPYKIPK